MRPASTTTPPPPSALESHLANRPPAEAALLAAWLARFAEAGGNVALAARLRAVAEPRAEKGGPTL